MHPIHFASAALFVATGVLLLVAEFGRAGIVKRIAVLLAFVTVIGADALLLANVPEIAGLMAPSGRKAPARKPSRHIAADDDGDFAMPRVGDPGAGTRKVEPVEIDDGSSGGAGWGSGAGLGGRFAGALGDLARAHAAGPKRETGDVIKDCADCPEVVVLPPGQARNAELPPPMALPPPADVNVWPGFAIGRREVTVAEFGRFLAITGRASKACAGRPIAALTGASAASTAASGSGQGAAGDGEPVACITYDDAVAYVGWLTGHTGHHYRLSSATEWLYASDIAPSLPNGPYGLGPVGSVRGIAAGGGIGIDASVAEIVGDCWRDATGVLAVAYGNRAACATRTVVDVPPEADQSPAGPLPRLPLAAGASSPVIGLRVVRELD